MQGKLSESVQCTLFRGSVFMCVKNVWTEQVITGCAEHLTLLCALMHCVLPLSSLQMAAPLILWEFVWQTQPSYQGFLTSVVFYVGKWWGLLKWTFRWLIFIHFVERYMSLEILRPVLVRKGLRKHHTSVRIGIFSRILINYRWLR